MSQIRRKKGKVFPTEKIDDGWPESAEKHVTPMLLEVVHKCTVVSVLLMIQVQKGSGDEQKGDNRDDMLDSKQVEDKKKLYFE